MTGKELADMMDRMKVYTVYCACKRPDGWGFRLGVSEEGPNWSTMVWMGREME